MNETIFRQKSLERIASPDKLDAYLKVSSPTLWLVVAALVLALASAGVWCFFGSLPTTVASIGLGQGTDALCFVTVEDGFSIEPGMKVRVTFTGSEDALAGSVEAIGEPQSAQGVAEATGAGWLAGRLPADWVCPVRIRLTEQASSATVLCSAQIILEERRPIELLLER